MRANFREFGSLKMEITLNRYSKIYKNLSREMVLLQGTGCRLAKKCAFCDYYLDVSEDPYSVNSPVIDLITGEFGVIDVINSGSVNEIDRKTLEKIRKKVIEKGIHTIWFESHWMYRNKLDDIRKFFSGINVKFRTGVETFNGEIREKWGKKISKEITASQIAEYFQGICLLFGIKGQTIEDVVNDIETADKYFEYFNLNIFNENTKNEVLIDKDLIRKFLNDVYPKYYKKFDKKYGGKAELLINNTDLGVG